VGETWGDPEGSPSTPWAVVLSPSGAVWWRHAWGSGRPGGFLSVAADDDGFVASGWIEDGGANSRANAWAQKITWEGATVWSKEIGSADADSRALCVTRMVTATR